MNKNMGITDKYIRMAVALAIASLYYFGFITGVAAFILIIVGLILAITSVFQVCPLYWIFKIDTCKRKEI